MRHKTAARKGEDGGWHYVDMGRDGGHPIGYCAEHEPHATEDEARECYGRYLREQTIRLNASHCGWTSCQFGRGEGETRCRQPAEHTAHYGDDGYGVVALCPEHMTVDGVLSAYPYLRDAAGDAWYS